MRQKGNFVTLQADIFRAIIKAPIVLTQDLDYMSPGQKSCTYLEVVIDVEVIEELSIALSHWNPAISALFVSKE
jgi:hypothetical protein